MDKQSLTEYVRVSILGREAVSDDQKALHFKRVEQGVGYAFDTLLTQINLDDDGKRQIESYYVKNYYNQAVKEDSKGYRYVGVSDSIVPIGEGRGIWYVQPSGGFKRPDGAGKAFVQSGRPKIALFRSLPIGKAMNEVVWRIGNLNTNLQIILENIGNSSFSDIRKIDYGVVRSFSSYDSDEDIRIPDGRMDLLEEMVRNWMQRTRVDNINNNQ